MAIQLDFSGAEAQRLKITREQQEHIRDLYRQASAEVGRLAEQAPRVPSDALRQQYLHTLQGQIDAQLRDIESQLNGTIRSGMIDTVKATVTDAKSFLRDNGLPIKGAYSHVPADIVRSVASGQLYTGNWTLSRALWLNTAETQHDVQSVIAQGIIQNKSAYDIAKDLEKYVNPDAHKDWDWSKVYPGTRKVVDYNAQRLARTMVSHAYQQAFVRTTQKNPFVSKYKWEASNSGRVCEICAERDGKLFDKDDLPLDHPNGMCTFTAVMDNLDIIGERLGDWAAGKPDPELDKWAEDLYGKGWEKRKEEVKTNPDNLPPNILETLGPKGNSISIDTALANTNPHYRDKGIDYKLYHQNCQRCVCAYEFQRRGYNVTAKAFDGKYPSILQCFVFDGKDYSSYVTQNINSRWSPSFGTVRNPNRFGYGGSSAAKLIQKTMTNWGDGSRAVLQVIWKDSRVGHIINVENVGGEVFLIDAQNGKKISGLENIESYMKRTTAANSELVRVDTLPIKTADYQRISEVVERRG